MTRQTVREAAESASYPLFIPFIMAGDPNKESTIELAMTMQKAGAHILELGIPYSDPLADGPVLQRSALRALKHGMSLTAAIELIPEMRKRGLTIPVIIFSYYNPVLRMGIKTFIEKLKLNEADGVLIPDLPLEESEELSTLTKKENLANISLVAPTSSTRLEKIAAQAEGFLYCVSSLGVTGTRDEFPPEAYTFIEEVKSSSEVPVAVGFGISTPEQVQRLQGSADGVIIGSAIMKKVEGLQAELEHEAKRRDALESIQQYVEDLLAVPSSHQQ